MISVVLNTASLGGAASLKSSKGRGRAYSERAALLRYQILPALLAEPLVSEIIVAGEFEKGEGYTYVHAPGPDANVWDQCFQKHYGALASSGDIVVFLCDDHLPDAGFFARLSSEWAPNRLWDILSPARLCEGKRLNNGWGEGYVGAHAIVMRRRALEVAPWSDVFEAVRGVWALDIPMTDLWQRRGLRLMTDPNLYVYDIEGNAFEHGGAT